MIEAHGKFFVVVIVLAIIFVGLALFLFYLDSRLRKAEKKLEEWQAENKDEEHVK